MRFRLGLLALTFLTVNAAAAQERTPGVMLEVPAEQGVRLKDEDVLVGRALKRVAPEYPKAAKRARVQGVVAVSVLVDERGRVKTAHADDADPRLAPAAVKAARQWLFEPTLVWGWPVRVTGTITFNFILQ